MSNTSKPTGLHAIKAVMIILICTAIFFSGCGTSPLNFNGKHKKTEKCAKHWKTQGFDFDSKCMTCTEMKEKALAMKRSVYWSRQGYSFDPNSMTAKEMDEQVKAQIFQRLTCCMIWQCSFAQTLLTRDSETY